MKIMEILSLPCLIFALALALALPAIRRRENEDRNIKKLKEKGIIK